MDRDGLIDYAGAELITGISRATLASMVNRKQIPHIRLGPRMVRFDPRELRAWIDSRRVAEQTREAPTTLVRQSRTDDSGRGRGDGLR